MPLPNSRLGRSSFTAPGAPRAGVFLLQGPPRRVTSRGMNDAVIRASNPPRIMPRAATSADMFRELGRAGMSYATAYADFSQGVVEGLGGSLKSAWSLVSHDMWQAKTYTELATTATALALLQPLNIATGLADAYAFDKRWGTHVAQRQMEIMQAIEKLVQDVPRWTPRQWGHAVGRLVGDIVLAKGAGAAAKMAVGVAVSETVHLRTISGAMQRLGAVPAGAGRLAKARAIIPVYGRFTMVRTAVPFLDVRTGINKTTFWSGLEKLAPNTEAFQHAEALARASGRTTLEMTKGGGWLGRQSKLLGNDAGLFVDWGTQLRPQWGRLSARFAGQARGSVEMYRGPRYAGSGSVWEQYEQRPLQELLKKGQVTEIKITDVPKK